MFCTICHHLLLLILIATTLTVNNIQVMAKLSKEDHRQSPRSGDPPAALARHGASVQTDGASLQPNGASVQTDGASVQPMGVPEWDHLNYIATVSIINCNAHYSYLIENLMDMYHGHLHQDLQALL